MSTAEFDKFDLEGLSLEEVEPAKPVQDEKEALQDLAQEIEEIQLNPVEPTPVKKVAAPEPTPAPAPAQVQSAPTAENSDIPEGKMVCPKCELLQDKAEQCAGCGVYIAKAQAQMGQSKIQITSTKF